jgi:hypothetical protein
MVGCGGKTKKVLILYVEEQIIACSLVAANLLEINYPLNIKIKIEKPIFATILTGIVALSYKTDVVNSLWLKDQLNSCTCDAF